MVNWKALDLMAGTVALSSGSADAFNRDTKFIDIRARGKDATSWSMF
jgi:hypothetical protein